MKIIIDRFEGLYAVVELENGTLTDMPKQLLPKDAKTGDIIDITINHNETQLRKEKIKTKMNSIFNE